MSEKRTPLEEFEFRQAARIRTPEEKRGKSEPRKKPLLLTVLLLILFLTAAAAAGFFYRQLQLEQIQTQQLKGELAARRKEIAKAQNDLKDIHQKLGKMTQRLSTSSKGKGELLTAIDKLKQQIDNRKREINSLKQKLQANTAKTKKLKKSLDKAKKKLLQAQQTSQSLEKEIEKAKSDKLALQDRTEKLQRTIQTLKNNMNQEGNASRKLVSDMLDAQSKAEALQKEKNLLEKQLEKSKNEISSLKRVDPGETVPFSDLVTPAKPIVHPTAVVEKKGVFGKIKGSILVNAYIDETGFVKNAFYLESHLNKEEKNSMAISEALKTVMKWRFSPALYNGTVPVKVWQPVTIPVTSK